MLRSVGSKVAWVGRTASMVFGLALVLALMLGVATMAFGANGDFFKVGKANVASAVSTLTKSGAGPALKLQVGSGPPLAVNSATRVANLNADKLDNLDSATFQRANAAAGGDLSGNYPNPQIAQSGVGSDEVADASLRITDMQGGSDTINNNFTDFPVPAQGCTMTNFSTSNQSMDVGDLVVTQVVSGTLPDGIYIPAYVLTKENATQRLICNATNSNINLNGQVGFSVRTVR